MPIVIFGVPDEGFRGGKVVAIKATVDAAAQGLFDLKSHCDSKQR